MLLDDICNMFLENGNEYYRLKHRERDWGGGNKESSNRYGRFCPSGKTIVCIEDYLITRKLLIITIVAAVLSVTATER